MSNCESIAQSQRLYRVERRVVGLVREVALLEQRAGRPDEDELTGNLAHRRRDSA